jgi:hypothetical protein
MLSPGTYNIEITKELDASGVLEGENHYIENLSGD